MTFDLGAAADSTASARGGGGDAKHDTPGSPHHTPSAGNQDGPGQDEQAGLETADQDQTSGAGDTDDSSSTDGQDGGTTSAGDTDSGDSSSGDNEPNTVSQDGDG